MVHVQDEGHDAIGSGQRIREHREKLFMPSLRLQHTRRPSSSKAVESEPPETMSKTGIFVCALAMPTPRTGWSSRASQPDACACVR